MDAVDPGEVRV